MAERHCYRVRHLHVWPDFLGRSRPRWHVSRCPLVLESKRKYVRSYPYRIRQRGDSAGGPNMVHIFIRNKRVTKGDKIAVTWMLSGAAIGWIAIIVGTFSDRSWQEEIMIVIVGATGHTEDLQRKPCLQKVKKFASSVATRKSSSPWYKRARKPSSATWTTPRSMTKAFEKRVTAVFSCCPKIFSSQDLRAHQEAGIRFVRRRRRESARALRR